MMLFGLDIVTNKLSQVYQNISKYSDINKDFNVWVNAVVK